MSTRCNIIIKGMGSQDIILYHHHDGYPQGVGYDLKTRLDKIQGRWYKSDIANFLVKDADDEYEITTCIHTDIDYLYTIDCDNSRLQCNKAWGREVKEEVILNFGEEENA